MLDALDEMAKTLADQPDSGPPAPQEPALETLAEAPGIKVEAPVVTAEKAPEETPADDVATLRSEIAGLEKRLTDTQGAFHRANGQEQMASQQLAAIANVRQRELDMAERGRALQPPVLADPAILHEDPAKLDERIQELTNYGISAVGSQIIPLARQVAALQEQVAGTLERDERIAIKEAKALVQDLGYDDWDQLFPSISKQLNEQGPGGKSFLRDSESLRNAYLIERANHNLPMAPSPSPTLPPTTMPTSASVRAKDSSMAERLRRLSPAAKEIQEQLNLEGGLRLDEDALARVGRG